jgi:hypothetical protein
MGAPPVDRENQLNTTLIIYIHIMAAVHYMAPLPRKGERRRGDLACVAMDLASRDFGELSGQIEDNARKDLDLELDVA